MEESAEALVRKRLRIHSVFVRMSFESNYEFRNKLGEG